VFRAIFNRIQTIPNSVFHSETLQKSLQELLLNMNPLLELPIHIKNMTALTVLGIAHSKITEIPSQIV